MIRLEELVAAVLNEMAIARTKATLFGVQMAADFRLHKVLRHLPVPQFSISDAEVSLPFAVADVSIARPMPGSLPLDRSDFTAVAKDVTATLPEQDRLKNGFSLYDEQAEHWRRQAAPAVAERFAADAAATLSICGLSTIYGYLVKSHYLLCSMERKAKVPKARVQQIVEAGFPDLLEQTARDLLTHELERRVAGHAKETRGASSENREEKEGKAMQPSVPTVIDSIVYIHATAEELKDAEHVSMLRLHLQEGTLDHMTLTESQEAGK